MRFIETVITWIITSAIAYVVAGSAAQTILSNETAAVLAMSGNTLSFSDRLDAIWTGLQGQWTLGPVIAIGFAIAFFVARLVKVVIPILAPIAYPVAGGVALYAIHTLIPIAVDTFIAPGAFEGLPGTEGMLGMGLQVLAGVIGGTAFELFRPKS